MMVCKALKRETPAREITKRTMDMAIALAAKVHIADEKKMVVEEKIEEAQEAIKQLSIPY